VSLVHLHKLASYPMTKSVGDRYSRIFKNGRILARAGYGVKCNPIIMWDKLSQFCLMYQVLTVVWNVTVAILLNIRYFLVQYINAVRQVPVLMADLYFKCIKMLQNCVLSFVLLKLWATSCSLHLAVAISKF